MASNGQEATTGVGELPHTGATLSSADGKNVDGLEDQTAFLPPRQAVLVFLALSIGVGLAYLDQTIIATALPKMASDLHSGRESSWIATAYLLTSLAFTPIYGRWSDVLGRKQVLITSMIIFTVSSLACALAQTMIQLIVFRAFQGMGGGGLIVMTFIIFSDIVSLQDRGKYMGITEIIIGIAECVGPLLGGVFSQYTTWRWVFWINLPLGGIAIAIAFWLVPLKGVSGDLKEKFFKIDYLGSVLIVLGSVLVFLALNWGGVTYSWMSPAVLVPMLTGALVFALFLGWEAKWVKLPIVPMRIFRYQTVVGTYITSLMNGLTLITILFYIQQFLQLARGMSAVKAGILTIPLVAPMSPMVYIAGWISSKTGHYRWMIIIGHAGWCVAQGLQSTINLESSDGKIIGILLMAGFTSGLTFQTALVAAQAAVPRHEMAVVTGVRTFVRIFGSAIGIAVAGAILNNSLRAGVTFLTREDLARVLDDPTIIHNPAFAATRTAEELLGISGAYLLGFQRIFYMTTAAQGIADIAALLWVKQHNLRRDEDEELRERGKEVMAKFKQTRQYLEGGVSS